MKNHPIQKRKITEGVTAEIFEYSPTKISKLYKPGFQHIQDIELNIISNLETLPLHSPKVFEKYNIDNRFGYIMGKINGNSLTELLEDNTVDTQTTINHIYTSQMKVSQCKISGPMQLFLL